MGTFSIKNTMMICALVLVAGLFAAAEARSPYIIGGVVCPLKENGHTRYHYR